MTTDQRLAATETTANTAVWIMPSTASESSWPDEYAEPCRDPRRRSGRRSESTIVMPAIAVVAHQLLSGQGTADLMLAILIGVVVYGGAFFLFGGAVLGDIRRLFGVLGVRLAAGPKSLPSPGRSELDRGSRP
jgi:hypothetical protein